MAYARGSVLFARLMIVHDIPVSFICNLQGGRGWEDGGITYVNECDGNDSTRKCDACTVLRRKYMDNVNAGWEN